MNNKDNCNCNCICEILCVILVLQDNACPDNCLQTCDRPILGGGTNCLICNTRPVVLYTCSGNGKPWIMPIEKDKNTDCTKGDPEEVCSTVFRVEKVENNCATFRVLAPNVAQETPYPYLATNVFFTMNCDCLCGIRCLSDTYVDCVG